MKRYTAAAALVLALIGSHAAAQTTATGTVTINVGSMLYISVTNTSPSFTPTGTEANAGFMDASATSLVTSKGNVQHTVTLMADAANFSYVGTGSPTKPASHLQVSVKPFGGSFGSYTGLSNSTPTNIAVNRTPGDHTADKPEVAYRVLVNFSDVPGTYTVGITYTVAAS